MFPDNTLSLVPIPAPLLPPKDVKFDARVSRHRGGLAVGDASEGLDLQNWSLSIEGNDLVLRDSTGFETVYLTIPGVQECSLAFDQNMRPTIAYYTQGVSYLYYYDSLTSAFTTLTLENASTPRVVTDDVRYASANNGLNDVLFFYVLGDRVILRAQRDRYLVVYDLHTAGGLKLAHVGMNRKLRVQLNLEP